MRHQLLLELLDLLRQELHQLLNLLKLLRQQLYQLLQLEKLLRHELKQLLELVKLMLLQMMLLLLKLLKLLQLLHLQRRDIEQLLDLLQRLTVLQLIERLGADRLRTVWPGSPRIGLPKLTGSDPERCSDHTNLLFLQWTIRRRTAFRTRRPATAPQCLFCATTRFRSLGS